MGAIIVVGSPGCGNTRNAHHLGTAFARHHLIHAENIRDIHAALPLLDPLILTSMPISKLALLEDLAVILTYEDAMAQADVRLAKCLLRDHDGYVDLVEGNEEVSVFVHENVRLADHIDTLTGQPILTLTGGQRALDGFEEEGVTFRLSLDSLSGLIRDLQRVLDHCFLGPRPSGSGWTAQYHGGPLGQPSVRWVRCRR